MEDMAAGVDAGGVLLGTDRCLGVRFDTGCQMTLYWPTVNTVALTLFMVVWALVMSLFVGHWTRLWTWKKKGKEVIDIMGDQSSEPTQWIEWGVINNDVYREERAMSNQNEQPAAAVKKWVAPDIGGLDGPIDPADIRDINLDFENVDDVLVGFGAYVSANPKGFTVESGKISYWRIRTLPEGMGPARFSITDPNAAWHRHAFRIGLRDKNGAIMNGVQDKPYSQYCDVGIGEAPTLPDFPGRNQFTGPVLAYDTEYLIALMHTGAPGGESKLKLHLTGHFGPDRPEGVDVPEMVTVGNRTGAWYPGREL